MRKTSGSGIGSTIFGLLIWACIGFAAYNFFFADGDDITGNYGFDVESGSVEALNYDLPENRNKYYELDTLGKELYGTLRDSIAAGKSTVYFHSLDYDDFEDTIYDAFDALYYDFPEFFWLNGGWSCQASQAENINLVDISFEPGFYEYWSYTTDKDGYIDAALSEAKRIAAMAATVDGKFEKVKFVHDYLVVNAEYDYVCLEELNKTVQRASSQQSHTIYGCLVNKVCVCDGYSKSFQLIMNMLDIDCELVLGNAGGGHAWNYVVLDGEAYWMDITWDENEQADESGDLYAPHGANYDYFCVTDEHLYKTHTPEDTFKVPVCNATEYNFFHHENSYLESYSFDAVCDAVTEQAGSQIIHIRFATPSALDEALDELVQKGRFEDAPGMKELYRNTKFFYSTASNTLHIYLP
ncbi:MAG: hypothetical protein IKK83_03905 [Clostridia bacterium]|nr:hypothetical protein [Clostridia bacterium]